ncbi:hypothetical protein HGG82_00010 [Marinomonas sp. M1K-6]|uniref:Uncharacterized protein n=1 Tax=Marinomonas profundi TaxID=2726122 RepID=A0A847QYZ3_9GAMM|nr:hypothetical protein [Marinomonas profundi]NLQ16002.1 hypothetical protein [Marinomonas profundi]UDV03404.1 hypothetical protein J8N69_00990 [Marinomonas profundi]
MNALATIALGAFAIIFFCLALIIGLIILKKYQAEQARLNKLARKKTDINKTNTDKESH